MSGNCLEKKLFMIREFYFDNSGKVAFEERKI